MRRDLDAQPRGPRKPIWRNRRWQVPIRSWVGVFALVETVDKSEVDAIVAEAERPRVGTPSR